MNKQDVKDRYSSQAPQPDQSALHNTIAAQMAEYEARGGTVEQLGYLVKGNEPVITFTRRNGP